MPSRRAPKVIAIPYAIASYHRGRPNIYPGNQLTEGHILDDRPNTDILDKILLSHVIDDMRNAGFSLIPIDQEPP